LAETSDDDAGTLCPQSVLFYRVYVAIVLEEQPEFDIGSWPVQDRCQDALDNIKSSHTVIPIPAYGTNGKLILPKDYERRLSGAIVEAHFTINHHYFKRGNRAALVAVVRRLDILRPPGTEIRSPVKTQARRQ
jgi:hypothetical protein